MLEGVELTARQTIWIIGRIKAIMMDYKHRIRADLPKIYSQDLLNNLFRHPYTKIEALQNDLRVSRLTASKYLDRLTTDGFVKKHKIGRYNYYVNLPLMQVFTEVPEKPEDILRKGSSQNSVAQARFMLTGFYSHQEKTFSHLYDYFAESFGVRLVHFSLDHLEHAQLERVLEDWAGSLEVGSPLLTDDLAFVLEVADD